MRATTLTVAITSLLMMILDVGYLLSIYSKVGDLDDFLIVVLSHVGSIFFYGGLGPNQARFVPDL